MPRSRSGALDRIRSNVFAKYIGRPIVPLSKAFTSGADTSVVPHQLDIFMFDPANDAYLGRLCSFNQCPKGKRDCLVPGCGAIAFNKVIDGFVPRADLLMPAQHAMLYRRGVLDDCGLHLICRLLSRARTINDL